MLKRILPLILASLLLLAACGKEQQPQTAEGLRIEIKAASRESLAVTWYNKTPHRVLYGDAFYLEYLEDGQWVPVEPKENTGFTSIGYVIEPNTIASKTYALPWIYDVTRYGTYRLKVNCLLYDTIKGTEQWLTAEFTLPSGDSPICQQPPEVGLKCSDPLKLSYVSCNWNFVNADGTMNSILADAPHPLQMTDLEFIRCFGDCSVLLQFDNWPAELVARCWKAEEQGNVDAASQAIINWTTGFQLRPGDYIYEITATWNDDGSGYYGTATYVFRAEAVVPEPHVRPIPS